MVLIERFGFIRQRMHEQAADANNGAGSLGTLDSIPQQRHTQAAALPALIDGEPPQDRHRDRVRHVALKATRGVVQGQGAGSQAVITHHPPGIGHHVGAGSAADLVGVGAALQPIVQACGARGKPVRPVFHAQQRGRFQNQACQGFAAFIRRS